MRDIEKYYNNTETNHPNKNMQKFIEIEKSVGNAIELGCGAGRDTIYLLKNSWKVLAIDKEDVKDRIIKRLTQEELTRFRFKKQQFENIELEDCDLLIANFSLSFCNKDKFDELWTKIVNSIKSNGYFVGNFFGINDEWKNIKKDKVFLSKEEVLKLFNEFEILQFKEIEKDSLTGLGKMKHWHIFDVIAKKK